VSLTISGWVSEAVFFWDDGVEQNAYVATNALEQDRFKLSGEAKIQDGWSAGYTIEIGLVGAPSNKLDQDNGTASVDANTPNNSLVTRKSNWWIKSKDYGKLTVGLDGTATYHLIDDADGANTRNYSDYQAAAVAQGRFFLMVNGARTTADPTKGLRWNDILVGPDNDSPGQSGRRNIVRYDSPTFAGFTISAAWGEDDVWDTKLNYKGDIGDFAVVGQIGYAELTDENTLTCSSVKPQDCQWFGVAGTIMHKPTGLYVYGGYAIDSDDQRSLAFANAETEDHTWYVQAGIEKKWMPLGKTTVFGEYRHDDAGSVVNKFIGTGPAATAFVKSSDLDFWAAGVVQNIENAAMDLYVIYRHAEGDVTNGNDLVTSLDDFDMVITGARIQF
jgi:predicted porin